MVANDSIRKTAEQTVVRGENINTVGQAWIRAVVVKDQGHKHKKTGGMENGTKETLINLQSTVMTHAPTSELVIMNTFNFPNSSF